MNYGYYRGRIAVLLAMVLVFGLVFVSCTPESSEGEGEPQPEEEKITINLAISQGWGTLDPYNHAGAYSQAIMDQIYERLTLPTHDGKFEPRLATEWEQVGNGEAYVFHLNEDAKWHDGEPVTAEDVAYTLQMVCNPKTDASRRAFARILAGTDEIGAAQDPDELGVEVLDEHTVRFDLKEPRGENAFLEAFTFEFWVLPKHILKDVPPEDYDTLDWHDPMIGAGPYEFVEQVEDEYLLLERNKDYHQGCPEIHELVWKVVAPTSLTAALKSGDIDVTAYAEVPYDDWDTVKTYDGFETYTVRTLGTRFMAINCTVPYLSDPRVRRAIWMGIDRQRLSDELLDGAHEVPRGPFSPDHPYFNEDLPEIPYDPDRARELLQEAGWDESQVVELRYGAGQVVREMMSTWIQEDLAEIGLKIEVRSMDFTALLSDAREGNYDTCLVAWRGWAEPELDHILHPNGRTAISHHNYDEIRKLVEEGVEEIGFENRKPIYDELQMVLQEKAPYIWLMHRVQRIAVSENLKNVRVEDFQRTTFNVWEWEWEESK